LDLKQRSLEMISAHTGIADSDWDATPPSVRALVEHLTDQIAVLTQG
jgi:hypothetical protein